MSRHITVYGQSLLKCLKRAVTINLQFNLPLIVVQSLSCVWLFETPWTTAHQASPSFPISRSLLKFMSIVLVMPSSHLVLCCPLLLLPSSIFLSIRVFSNESALRIRWPKYWSFSISPSSEYSRLISFRIYWLDLLAVHPKGNQSWIFIGRTDAEAPILWPSDVKNWLIGKTLMLGKTEGRRRGWQRTRWLDGIANSMDMSLSKL